jgi:hypothetical protein
MCSVEQLSPAEDLPALYRAVLDGVAELERLGERREAGRVRSDAVRAYSRSWDASGRKRLETILRRAQRAVAQTHRSGAEPVQRRVTSPL